MGVKTMAFIRKRGNSYYLVHNVRKNDRVEQLHLARLGRRPRISDEIIRAVTSKHPFVQVDWESLKEKTSRGLVQPFENNSQYVRDLLSAVRNVHWDVADLHLPVLGATQDPDLVAQLTSELKLLRATLDVKLMQRRTGKPGTLRT